MKTCSFWDSIISLSVLLLVVSPATLVAEDSRLQNAQAQIRLLINTPTELPVAAKELVQPLGAENRRAIRTSMAQEALALTNFTARLALLNFLVDPTIWTNATERNLSDNDLTCSLRQVYKQESRTAIRRRAEVALLQRESPSSVGTHSATKV